jgi:hypothetical protein
VDRRPKLFAPVFAAPARNFIDVALLAKESDTTDEAVALEADTYATTYVTVVVTIVTVTTMVPAATTVDEFQVSIGQFNFANRVRREAATLFVAQAQAILVVFPGTYDVKVHVFLLSLLSCLK